VIAGEHRVTAAGRVDVHRRQGIRHSDGTIPARISFAGLPAAFFQSAQIRVWRIGVRRLFLFKGLPLSALRW
jgi:hypothetical protein